MTFIISKYQVLLMLILICTLGELQVSGVPAVSDVVQKPNIEINSKNPAVIKQEDTSGYQEADDDISTPSNGGRFGDFLRGINTILNGILTLDFKNALGGTFQFIPPRVRSGVEKVVASIIGAPRATTASSLIFPEVTTNNASLSDLDISAERTSENETGVEPNNDENK